MCTSFVRRHIFALPIGQLFTTRDLLSYGPRAAVDQALYRMVKSGLIIRLARGVFARDGSEMPSAMEVAAVKARAFGKEIAIHARDLAHALGLPCPRNERPTFAVNRRSSSFRFGETVIQLQETGPKQRRLGESKAGQVIKALWHLGRAVLHPSHIAAATAHLGRTDREEIRLSARWMPSWLSDHFLQRRPSPQTRPLRMA